jgi:hypothetical protein
MEKRNSGKRPIKQYCCAKHATDSQCLEITAYEMVKFSDKNYLFDFGRNISGVSKIKIKGEAGTEIRLIHAERLGKNGKADFRTLMCITGQQTTKTRLPPTFII